MEYTNRIWNYLYGFIWYSLFWGPEIPLDIVCVRALCDKGICVRVVCDKVVCERVVCHKVVCVIKCDKLVCNKVVCVREIV